jgi:hypothetical protein
MASAREFVLRIGGIGDRINVMCVMGESLAVKGEVDFSSRSCWSEGRRIPSPKFLRAIQHSSKLLATIKMLSVKCVWMIIVKCWVWLCTKKG